MEKAVGSEVIGGSVNENGVLYVQVTRTGDDSTLSRIIRFVEDAQGRKAPISKTADKVAGVFVPVVMGIALAAAIAWAIAGQPLLLRAAGVHVGAGDRLPLRPGPGHPHRHHGGHGPGRQARHSDPLRRDFGDHPQRGHRGAGQDRHRHRGHPCRDGGPALSVHGRRPAVRRRGGGGSVRPPPGKRHHRIRPGPRLRRHRPPGALREPVRPGPEGGAGRRDRPGRQPPPAGGAGRGCDAPGIRRGAAGCPGPDPHVLRQKRRPAGPDLRGGPGEGDQRRRHPEDEGAGHPARCC